MKFQFHRSSIRSRFRICWDVTSGRIEGGTFGDCRHRIHRRVNIGRDFFHKHLAQVGRVGRTTHEDEFSELLAVQVVSLEYSLADCNSLLEERLHDRISHLTGDGQVEFYLPACVVAAQLSKVGEDFCTGCGGELNLGRLRIALQGLAQHCCLLLSGQDLVHLEVLLDVGDEDAVHQGVVDVLASEVAVTLGIHHLLHATVHTEQCCIEGATAQVEDEPEAILLAGCHAIGDGSGDGFLQQLDVLESGQTSRFHGGRLLSGIKLGWHGDNDAAAVVYPGISGKSFDDLSRELLRGEVLLEVLAAVGLDGAHRALELLEDVG